jgi:chromosomal replication initiation ATPase DnaA
MAYTCACCGVKIPPAEARSRVVAHEREVLEFYRVTRKMIEAPTKAPFVVSARHELWYRLVAIENRSTSWAGNWTGGHDHTTVLNGVRRHSNMLYDTGMHTPLAEIRSAAQAPLLKLMEVA